MSLAVGDNEGAREAIELRVLGIAAGDLQGAVDAGQQRQVANDAVLHGHFGNTVERGFQGIGIEPGALDRRLYVARAQEHVLGRGIGREGLVHIHAVEGGRQGVAHGRVCDGKCEAALLASAVGVEGDGSQRGGAVFHLHGGLQGLDFEGSEFQDGRVELALSGERALLRHGHGQVERAVAGNRKPIDGRRAQESEDLGQIHGGDAGRCEIQHRFFGRDGCGSLQLGLLELSREFVHTHAIGIHRERALNLLQGRHFAGRAAAGWRVVDQAEFAICDFDIPNGDVGARTRRSWLGVAGAGTRRSGLGAARLFRRVVGQFPVALLVSPDGDVHAVEIDPVHDELTVQGRGQ